MSKKLHILVHVLAVLFFLFLCFVASPDWPRVDRMLSNPNGIKDFVFQLEMIVFFYLNFFWLLPLLYYRKRYMLYVGCIIGLFILFVPVTNYLIDQLVHHSLRPGPIPRRHHGGGFHFIFLNIRIYTFLLVFSLSFLLKVLSHMRELKSQQLVSELDLLKAQINPHFFFNTLNLIYSLSVDNSQKTSETILRLSSMMRYVLKSGDVTFVALEKELSYIQDYIEMQKMRLDKTIQINYSVSGDLFGLVIAPMILIPYIENAFKHGVKDEGTSFITISIALEDERLYLKTQNSIGKPYDSFEKTQIGQANSSRRLELMYPGKHSLHVSANAEVYELNLELQLTLIQ